MRRPTPTSRPSRRPSSPPGTLDPRWLLQALAAVIALSACAAYLTLCLLFYAGQWQFVLHPSRAVPRTPASQHLVFAPVRFGDNLAGTPQLTGWWIPSDLPGEPAVLMLHTGDGSMSDALPAARALHDARLSVLLFDYRGYGQSGGHHPNQRLMQADAESALLYLNQVRHIPLSSIVVYGAGLGASLAVHLCGDYPSLPALILQSADGDTRSRVLADQRTHFLPVRLLFHERFPLADPLSRLQTPKLLISFTKAGPPEEAKRAADPKTTLELPPRSGLDALTPAIRRFVDTYLPTPPGKL